MPGFPPKKRRKKQVFQRKKQLLQKEKNGHKDTPHQNFPPPKKKRHLFFEPKKKRPQKKRRLPQTPFRNRFTPSRQRNLTKAINSNALRPKSFMAVAGDPLPGFRQLRDTKNSNF